MTIVIGLIGGIGCGKSTVSKVFVSYGAELFDADRAGHAALCDPAIKAAIESRWGKTVFTPAHDVSRQELARIVFSNEEELKYLNQLVHPYIIDQFMQSLEKARQSGARLYILDAPLLLETGLDRYCDHIIYIDTNEKIRMARVIQRGWSVEEFKAREKNQFSLQEKRKKADYVLDNNETLAKMKGQVSSIIENLTVFH